MGRPQRQFIHSHTDVGVSALTCIGKECQAYMEIIQYAIYVVYTIMYILYLICVILIKIHSKEIHIFPLRMKKELCNTEYAIMCNYICHLFPFSFFFFF